MKIFNKKKTLSMLIIISTIFCTLSCKKQNDWLDVKRSKSDVTPTTLKDVQALIDNDDVMNNGYPQFGLIGADNNYITDENLNLITKFERNAYIWNKDIYEGTADLDWTYAYKMIGYANISLDALEKINVDASNQTAYNSAKGSALFYRSFGFYNLAQLYCKPYDKASASTTPGIPLRLTSDVNIISTRATVKAIYDQMTGDLTLATTLLPSVQSYKTRPTNAAAMALLAKVYLSMEDYQNAGKLADLALQKSSTLLDFNNSSLPISSVYPFPDFYTGNPEILFYATCNLYLSLSPYPIDPGYTNPDLYNSYEANDLRKSLFYSINPDNTAKFIGSYTGTYTNFGGLGINEVYLINAECLARAGNYLSAMDNLNALLKKRYKDDGSFTGLTAIDASDALHIILSERRKELPCTGQLRWEDLRRLNKDPKFAITLQRTSNGINYTLPPNDNRYTFPIPDVEIQLNKLDQNPR